MTTPNAASRRTAAAALAALVVLLWLFAVPAPAQDAAPPAGSSTVEATAPSSSVDVRPSSEVGLVAWFQRGGVFMWPLLACSIAALAVILERLFTMQRARTHTRRFMNRLLIALREKGVDEAIEICTRTRGPVAAILHSGLLKVEKGTEAVEKAIETAGASRCRFCSAVSSSWRRWRTSRRCSAFSAPSRG